MDFIVSGTTVFVSYCLYVNRYYIDFAITGTVYKLLYYRYCMFTSLLQELYVNFTISGTVYKLHHSIKQRENKIKTSFRLCY